MRREYTGAMDYNNEGEVVTHHHGVPHYYGDQVRILFVTSAALLLIAQSTGAELPMSTTGAVISAVLLVIAAGITNPIGYHGIHWLNACIATLGTLLFGISAVSHYRSGISIFDPSFVYTEIIALLSLIALYLTTRTIRGIAQRSSLYK